MILKLVRTPGVYLIGFMGCGKSTIGRLLAEKLGWDFYDLDDDIEKNAGKAIADIFDSDGEGVFRTYERKALADRVHLVQGGHAMVLALGGGACVTQSCMERLSNNGVTIFLDCDFATIQSRVAQFEHRPLTRDPGRFQQLYEERRPLYMLAEHRIETASATPDELVARILKLGVF